MGSWQEGVSGEEIALTPVIASGQMPLSTHLAGRRRFPGHFK
jgi:hypothetical protein